MKFINRIIPILIVIVICISVIPFAVFSDDTFTLEVHKVYSTTVSFYYRVYSTGVTKHVDFGNDSVIYVTLNKNTNYLIYYKNNSTGSYTYVTPCFRINTTYKTLSNNHSSPTDLYYLISNFGNGYIIEYTSQGQTYTGGSRYITYNQTGYTLTFNSNGGSPIAPITDIEPNGRINFVDQFGFYLPNFVPERTGFIFDYWYLIDNPLHPVTSIVVTEDTVLNAKYTVDSTYSSIYFTSGFYHDSACTNAISGRVIEQIGSTYTFYYNSSNATGNFHGQITLDGNGYSKEYTGTEVSSGVYKYDIIVPSVETTVNVLTYETYDCTLYVFGGIWNDYVANVYINSTPVLTEQQIVHFDGYTGIHLEFDMYPPYVITDIVFTDVLYGPFSYEVSFNVSDTIVEMVGGDWGFYTHVDAYCYPNQDGVIQVWNRSITEYDITSRAPIIVYDESGNASWAFSEVDVMDTDWSQVQENIPRKLFGIFDGLFTLEGLAVLIPVIMMVSFTVWFLRRS